MSQSAKKRKVNSQTGTIWITNGSINRKIRGDIPEGWIRGRTKI